MKEDPIVAEVRQVREQLARQHNYDLHAIFEELRQKQASLGARLVRLSRKPSPEPAAGDSAPLHPGR